jgi:U4/U6 small nuclear ribonucleoprotein PRP4
MKTIYTIPAHVNLISDIKFFKGSHILKSELFDTTLDITGGYLMSSSFDGTIKVWSSTDFKLLKSINAHEGKVMGLDISRGNLKY